MKPNILFIMCDQLRFDYLGCTGHPTIRTPNIDRLAQNGVRFDRAYVQSPICGPSRMSFYTGRYTRSHGSTWNGAPLRVGEMNFGDHLNPLGMRTALSGKTHMAADIQGMQRLGIDPASPVGEKLSTCGFEEFDRIDGVHPAKLPKKPSHYNAYLNRMGYDGADPWETWANAVEGPDGEPLNGWMMQHARKPARVKAEHSETAYTAMRGREFIEGAGDDSWCLHLSFIKPHWPYVAPAPYNDMYGAEDIQPAQRDAAEKDNPHPVLGAFQRQQHCETFARDEVREAVIPTYMGMITQIDDEIGQMMEWLAETGRDKNTVVVFTSDHGDYLGDHWLGEKELFHEPSVRIPLIIHDPSLAADATRGTVCDALVEAIDLLPTFVELAGGEVQPHILEGRSLVPFLQGQAPEAWRDVVFSEYDYAFIMPRHYLGREISECRLQMVFDGRWKLIHAEGFRPMLYDLQSDPLEIQDLGDDPAYAGEVARLTARLLRWATSHHNRVTRSDAQIAPEAGLEPKVGVLIGFWEDADMDVWAQEQKAYGID